MTNTEKAREIAEMAHKSCYLPIEMNETYIENGVLKHADTIRNDYKKAIKYGALTMARWKDEQHKAEKQQWIDKACRVLSDLAVDDTDVKFYTNERTYLYNLNEKFIARFKEAMEG